jgi:hypothetical protein
LPSEDHPNKDYLNKFMHVVNTGLQLLDSVDWDKLAKIAYQETVSNKKRQHKFKDIGTTGGQCTTCTGSSVGVAKPGKKPGLTDPSIVEAMVAQSEFTRQAKFKWMPTGVRPFNCDDQNNPGTNLREEFTTIVAFQQVVWVSPISRIRVDSIAIS